MLTLAVPMAMLVSSMMTFGTMSSNNEITILKASGVSLIRLMIPVVLISILMFYLMLRFNNDVLPEANHQARILLYDITKTKPTFILEPGKFSDDLNGVQILVKKTFPNSNNIEGVYIYNYSNPNSKDLLTAKSGDISFSANFEKVIMNLNNGEIHQYNMVNGKQDYRKINFEKHRLSFDAEGFGFKKSDDNTFSRGDRELSADAMKAVVDSLKVNRENMYEIFVKNINSDLSRVNKINFMDTVYYKDQKDTAVTDDIDITRKRKITSYDTLNNYIKLFTGKFNESKNLKNSYLQLGKQINSYDVEIYKKYSIPFACIVFVLVGAPLGYRVRRGGFGIAAGMSLLFFLLYWACLIGGEKLADRGIVSAFTGMWIADIIIGCLGLYLIFKSS
jgi:lipopolysaccharide export system permease protein